jgi:hypothetical protein
MKYNLLTNNKIFLILIICILLNSLKCENKKESKSSSESNKTKESEFTTPIMVKSLSTLDQINTLNTLNTLSSIHTPVQSLIIPKIPTITCGCASLVKCQPCGMVLIKPAIVDCPCAPKPKCPVCPPLSIIHEMAAKKALQDQKLTYNLRGYTSKINSLLDSITKYSGDVVKFELKAKEMSQKMEEASLKASFARKNMFRMSEQAKMIAKQTINPCYGIACNGIPGLMPFEENKIFPEEIDSIKSFGKTQNAVATNFSKN